MTTARLNRKNTMSYANPSPDEKAANDAIKDVLKSLQRARELCERAGYEAQVLVPLSDAHREIIYAYDTATGRN